MDLDDQLCYCYHISKRKIVNFVRQTRPARASMISQCLEAGSGCGWCIPFLKKIHKQVLAGQEVDAEAMTPEEYEALRARYRAEVRDGKAQRNTHDDAFAGDPPPVEPHEDPPGSPTAGAGKASGRKAEEPFDYTRYFSRSRPEPEPETIERPRRKKDR
jgi:bacterioferritin-associated ferredoxin